MASTATPLPDGAKPIRVQRSVFDLDSRDDVTLVKSGTFQPVSSMQDFVTRLGNDSEAILAIVNDGLEEYDRKRLAADESVKWQIEDEDSGELAEFTGTPISEEKSKQLAANVLQMAKMSFGFAKGAGREKNKAAKTAAREMLLSLPQVIETLKK